MSTYLECPKYPEPGYPNYSALEGQQACNGAYIGFGNASLGYTIGSYLFIFIILMSLSNRFVALAFFNFNPALDLLTDIAYVLTVTLIFFKLY